MNEWRKKTHIIISLQILKSISDSEINKTIALLICHTENGIVKMSTYTTMSTQTKTKSLNIVNKFQSLQYLHSYFII